ncbi:GNAT family N-acetyltransferase [Halorussus salilacus]|uniref:GNAT family N-acetyltransferase n=1 Tax=Halorussus salilacus TaxID=2953750 RepID=UPI00209DF480|nr:GNAT family N-acetyltransferase [Halorussus salilacus]USZ69674.1 GNAT family N-acetyltransferase [Halorussus salilacus]
MTATSIHLREARHDDYEDVAAFTENTWPDREGGDYIPRVYHDWIDGDDRRTVVADAGDDIAGIVQCVMLSEWEAWGQGMRVNPAFRGRGVANRMTEDLFEWARGQGATVLRNMVFSWNVAGLGQSRAAGYDPATEFRWATPEPDPDAVPRTDADFEIAADPDAAWRFWTDSPARDHLRGLALDRDESWAVSQLTREDLRTAADDDGLFVVQGDGTEGFAHRVREYEREGDESGESETETWVEYGVGAWTDAASADAVLAAVARDAADRGADRTRVLIPETVRAVSDVAACRVSVSAEPDFVMAADLTGGRGRT